MEETGQVSAQASQQHPKLSDAETLERAAEDLERLREYGKVIRDQLQLVRSMLALSGRSQWAEENRLPYFDISVSSNYMRHRARELRKEFEEEMAKKEPVKGGFDNINPSGKESPEREPAVSDFFIKRFQLMARELDINGEQALAVASQPVHDVFVRTFFKRLREFGQALQEAGVMEKNV